MFPSTVFARERPSIASEHLLRASLIQTLFSIRSERQLVQNIEHNLLYCWFVGMNLDEPLWNHSTFSANRERLFSEAMTQRFFAQVLRIVEWQSLISDEHFTVDGTMIEAWASAATVLLAVLVAEGVRGRCARDFCKPVRQRIELMSRRAPLTRRKAIQLHKT